MWFSYEFVRFIHFAQKIRGKLGEKIEKVSVDEEVAGGGELELVSGECGAQFC